MLQRLRKARLLWPTLATLTALAVLLGLGNWQMRRKAWKEDLIAKMTARVHADPVPLATVLGHGAGKDDLEYEHVTVSGRFRHDKERFLYAPTPSGQGWHVFTPLQTADGAVLWVNRGIVPEARKGAITRTKGLVDGEVEVRGLVRVPPGPGMFDPQNDLARNIWYWPDLAGLTASAFDGGPEAARVLPVIVEADAEPAPPGGLPRGGVTRLELPNRHLEYALTWYGLAATLVGVYLAFSINRLRAVA